MEPLLMGLALAFNILVIIWKIRHRGFIDGLTDALLLAVVMFMSGGTLTGMLVGTIASAVVSAYLLVYPLEPISFSFPRIRLPKLPSFSLPRVRLPQFNIWSNFKKLLHLPTISIKWS